ncbi:MAG: calcium-binding protein, partial [Pseudomonadota bacterium]
MTLFFGEDYIIQSTDVVLTPSGGQFGPDATGSSYEEFFGVGGDTPVGGDFSLGGSITLNIPFVGPTDILTARLFGNVGATFGLNISASLDPGSVDATLPYEVVVAFPDLEPTQGGEIVDIFFGTTLDPTAEGAGFTTQFPSFTFGIDLVAELSARLAAELGSLGANTSFEIFDFTAGTVIPIVSVDTNRELANGDANPIELFGVDTPTLVDEIPGLDPAFNDAGEFAGIGVPLNTFVSSPEAEAEPKTDVEKEGDEQPDEEEPDLSGIDLGRIEVFVPNINTASSFADGVFVTDPTRKAVYNDDGSIDVVDDLDADGNNLGEGNRDDLAKLTLDLDGIVTYATGGAFPPLEFGASVGGSFGPAFFDAGFSYNLFDVELISALPLEQEFTLTPKVQTQLQFFEANDDGTKGEEKEVEVNMQRKVLRFDETGTFRDETIEARLRELADANSTFAQDIDLFVDFNSGITGAFTGQTNSIGGRMIISRDGGRTFEELFTNAADPIASSTPALGENQNVDLVLDENTVLGYRLFIGSGSNEVQEDYVIEFDQSDTVYVEEIEQISQFITETPFLDDLQAINLIYDADDTFVEVVTKSVPVVTNRTGLEFDLSLLLRGLAAEASFSAGIDLGIFTIETGIGFEIGPLFEEEFPLLNLDIVDIFNGAFVLEDTKTSSFVLGDAAAAPDLGDAIEGSSGNDTLMGTEEADVIVSFEGDDTIIALGGNDIIAPGLGEGSIDGGAGSDLID